MEKLKLVVATGNKNKLKEIQEILPTFDLVTMKEIGFNEEIVEDGKTFEENALIKARAVWKHCKELVMADDSGLEIDFLGKEPGIYSARYMEENTSYKIKNENLISRLKGVEGNDRSARFVAVIVCILPSGEEIIVRDTMEGIIAYEAKGENGFGYDPILFLPEYQKTSAELSDEEKNKISHRGKALEKMKKELCKLERQFK